MSLKKRPIVEYHKSVLAKEVLEYLDPQKGDVVVDATFGFGGHSRLLLDRIGASGKIIAIEQDTGILEKTEDDLDGRINLVNDNFVNLKSILKTRGIQSVDKILFDLGVSSYHYDKLGMGFSFDDDQLDMRLDRLAGSSAADLVNSLPENELADLLYENADEYKSRRIAKAIVQYRKVRKITSAKELTDIIKDAIRSRGRINPATKTFQALRIAVNNELNNLKIVLPVAIDLLNDGGRIVVIAFHSLEDRIVKHEFKKSEKESAIKILTKKPITADFEEIKENPRARSAKLRAAERLK